MKWVFKKILFPGENWGQSQNRRAFTLIEVTVALIVFGMIAATVLVVINKAIETVVMWQTKMQAFEIARENMEKILAQSSVIDSVEYGMSETNPDITWETIVSSFYEPLTNQMWIRAVCTAQFVDSEGKEQKIELTHWLAGLNKEQIRQILEQKQREEAYQASLGESADKSGESSQQTEQEDEAATWKEMEKIAGPPPEGYDNWGQVPEEQFWNVVMKTTTENK